MGLEKPAGERNVRLRVGIGAVAVIVIVALGGAVLVSAVTPRGVGEVLTPELPVEVVAPSVVSGIFVHVLGAVERPGLYELPEGSRGVDIVAAAGGFAEGADQGQLNLARLLSDGEQIYVPQLGEVGTVAAGGVTSDGKVNLNTADATALETLPRVGPSLAARIIAWRESNGRFSVVEDLLSVSGIGAKTFEGIREHVTV